MIKNATPAVHRALPNDVVRLRRLAQEFYDADSWQYSPCSAFGFDAWLDFWTDGIQRGIGVILYCTDTGLSDGEPVGFIAGILSNNPMDGALDLTECLWFVRTDTGGPPCGMSLLSGFEGVGEESGAARVNMSHLANNTGVRLARIFSRWGYAPVEVAYSKRIGGD